MGKATIRDLTEEEKKTMEEPVEYISIPDLLNKRRLATWYMRKAGLDLPDYGISKDERW